jgi:anti-sigma B factor antagonist
MADTPAIQVDRQPNAVVVRVTVKDLDEIHIAKLRDEMDPHIAQSPATPFIVDLSTVKFVPSLTLGVLVKMSTEFRGRKQRLILVSLTPIVRQVFTITRLDKIFEIQDNVAAALQSVAPASQPQ